MSIASIIGTILNGLGFRKGSDGKVRLSWNNINNIPTDFPPSTHTHNEITEATSENNANKIVKRDSNGNTRVSSIFTDGDSVIKGLTEFRDDENRIVMSIENGGDYPYIQFWNGVFLNGTNIYSEFADRFKLIWSGNQQVVYFHEFEDDRDEPHKDGFRVYRVLVQLGSSCFTEYILDASGNYRYAKGSSGRVFIDQTDPMFRADSSSYKILEIRIAHMQ